MIEYIGWLYTAVTITGSCCMAFRGESRRVWGIYVASTVVGMAYFAIIGDASQFVLVAFFCAMNAYAIIRLGKEARKKKATRVERPKLLAFVITSCVAGTIVTACIDVGYTGWIYTAATVFGSLYLTTTGETKVAWGIYISAAVVGMAYFVAVANPSQFALSLFFCINNSIAVARLKIKEREVSKSA